MWFQKLGRRRARTAAAAAALLLGIAAASCTPSYVTGSDAPVNLIVATINEGSVLDSDIRTGAESSFICEDEVQVALAVRNKNPNGPVPVVPSHVLLTSYEVRYFRTDGRGVEGVDVPFRITGNLAGEVDVASSGATSYPIEVVRRQAKLEPPLSTIGQTAVLTVMAEVTIFGQTIAGQRVSASGRFQIDFADFGDTNGTCPTQGQ
jgi:hypothetical protein